MTDLRAVVRITQPVQGPGLVDMVIFGNCKPSEYYAQTEDKYLNKPITKGYVGDTKIAHASKWYNFITGELFFFNEVDTESECGWYDEEGTKNV